MDEETVERVKNLVNKTAEKYKINLEKVIIFGSRAREDYTKKSDVDLLLVSPDFKNIAWNKRPGPFYEEWDYKKLPEPEFICLTPKEFKEKKKKKPHIARNAVEKGVTIKGREKAPA